MIHEPRYGRLLDDFVIGDVYLHPWEVTLDEGMLALFAASFQLAEPTFSSSAAARAVGLRDRPVHPLLLLSFGLSFSVHDVSERAIAHLAYLDVRFPEACYVGDTVCARTLVLGKKPVSSGDKGVIHVRTELVTDAGLVVCSFERKALIRAGSLAGRPASSKVREDVTRVGATDLPRAPAPLRGDIAAIDRPARFSFFWEDLTPGDVIVHANGRTVSEAEHMMLTTLVRNSHPLHFDEHYCKTGSFAKTRVVYGGLVLAWALSLSSRDTAGNAIWDLGLDDGAHPGSVLAGDTIFAASKVLDKKPRGPFAGEVTLRVVGVKNTHPRALLDRDLFTPELGKIEGKVPEKIVEITRTLLVRRRTAS